MVLKKCAVEACGAMVLMVELEGALFPVNPFEAEMIVLEADGGYRMVKGYQPHRYTCVDIGRRTPKSDLLARGE